MKRSTKYFAFVLTFFLMAVAIPDRMTGGLTGNKTKLVWKKKIESGYPAVMLMPDDRILTLSNSGQINAFNISRGKKLWAFDCYGRPGKFIAADQNAVITTTSEGKVIAILAGSGAEKWNYQAGSSIKCTPLVAGENIFVYSRDQLICLDKEAGLDLWTSNLAVEGNPDMVYFDNRLFLTGLSKAWCVDANNGKIIWDYHIPAYRVSGVAVNNSNVAFINAGNLIVLDANTGKEKWSYSFETGEKPASLATPLLIDNKIYGTFGSMAFCADLKTKSLVWQKKFTTPTSLSEPKFIDNQLVFHDNQSNLYFLSLNKGKKNASWSLKPENIKGRFEYFNNGIFFINSQSELCAVRLLE